MPTPTKDDDDGDDPSDGSTFPMTTGRSRFGRSASAIHTDDGTTLASGADALVIGGDGFDDDDNRAAGENIVITRDDGNVVVGAPATSTPRSATASKARSSWV